MPANTPDQQLTLPVLGDAADQAVSFGDYNTDVEPRLVHFYVDAADRTARNPTPPGGQVSFLAAPGRWDRFMPAPVTAWWELGPVFVRKPTEVQVVNNSIAFVNDDALFLPMQSNARYTLTGMVVVDSGVTADVKFDFTGPAGFAVPRWYIHGADTANAFTNLGSAAAGTAIARVGLGIGTFVYLPFTAIVTTAATAGNLQLRWSQNALEAVNTRVKTDSWLALTRVG